MERAVRTIGELKELGIWEKVCELNHWDEEFVERVNLPDDWKISFSKRLLPEQSTN